MDYEIVVGLEVLYSIAVLMLISVGLAVVFGMMRIINLAHGEFMTIGGYTVIVSVKSGVNIYFAMLVVAPLVVGLLGMVVERLIIRYLYGRLIDTMLATWGLSLALIGLLTMIFGNTTTGISTPIPGIKIGEYQMGGYNIFIIGVTFLLMLLAYGILKYTPWGLVARGSMQSPEMAVALGYNPSTVYMITFAFGTAITGMAGAIMAPLVGIIPSSGINYIAKAFITVISGGASAILGSSLGAIIYGFINQMFTLAGSSVLGEIALLIAAIILLRLLPTGITGHFFKDKL